MVDDWIDEAESGLRGIAQADARTIAEQAQRIRDLEDRLWSLEGKLKEAEAELKLLRSGVVPIHGQRIA